jgi:hypothetical protein
VLKVFQAKPGPTSDPGVRAELANIAENTARALRNDPAFQARFGDILPHAEVAGVGATLQTHLRVGVPLTSLGPEQHAVARGEAAAAIEMAKARLGGVPTSANLENFLFDASTGRITGWFDHLSHQDLPKHLNLARQNAFEGAPEDVPAAARHPEGSLVRADGDPRVFLIRGGRRWHVPDLATFAKMGFRAEDVQVTAPHALDPVPIAIDLPVLHGPRLPAAPRDAASLARLKEWSSTTERMLESGVPVGRTQNAQQSANTTQILTLRAGNGRLFRGVWKPESGENATIEAYPPGSPFAGSSPYPLGALFKNEVRAAKLASALGLGHLFPPTVERTVDGVRGSLQLFLEGATSAAADPAGRTLDRAATEQLRVFDYLIGNADRSPNNVMLREHGGTLLPIGIDNGLTFPHGTTAGLRPRPFPTAWLAGHVGPLLDETRAFIAAIEPATVAKVLMGSGADPRQAAHALRRLERLKRDPSFLAIHKPGPAGATEMLARVADAAESRNPGLPDDVLEGINRTLAAASR